MSREKIIIVGGGAAGFFGAITTAENNPKAEISIYEKSPNFLSKVRISGGGRCNVTHSCFDVRELSARYPRGDKALISPFNKFQARDTIDWFSRRGVALKTESDGRMFPITDSSETIIDCLMSEARRLGIRLIANCGVELAERTADGFALTLSNKEQTTAHRLLLATGGCRTPALGKLPVSLGHTLIDPVPSLFTFHIEVPWLRELAGVACETEASVPGTKLRERGPMLLTHWGLSGPVILRLSAWGARELSKLNYSFPLLVQWLPRETEESLRQLIQQRMKSQPAKQIGNSSVPPLPGRLWEKLVAAANIPPDTRWSSLRKNHQHQLVQQLLRTEFKVTGKSLNKDEFVTCGGVKLSEVDFKTMESRLCPGLYFAGELLDVDGITGGFNFQAAWTTGWLAGRAMAGGPMQQ
ncbi:MAG: NAD(P)/FAD-dependent oxidoreductase [Verrucomicrobiales bacterium]